MDLHYSKRKPDWLFIQPPKRNTWQRIAYTSRGVITPGNVLSVNGLLLVVYGAFLVSDGRTLIGLLAIVVGRILDLADGYVANKTGTKSRLGEAVDSVADKFASAIVFVLFAIVGIMALWQIVLLFLLQLSNAVASLLAKRQGIALHTSKTGKYATLLQWITIGLYAGAFLTVERSLPHEWLTMIAHVFFAVSMYIGIQASTRYIRILTRKSLES
ncbi:hypothetical protein BH23PAT2_BH23PAT2_03560 [soil metagenome]